MDFYCSSIHFFDLIYLSKLFTDGRSDDRVDVFSSRGVCTCFGNGRGYMVKYHRILFHLLWNLHYSFDGDFYGFNRCYYSWQVGTRWNRGILANPPYYKKHYCYHKILSARNFIGGGVFHSNFFCSAWNECIR